jgi:hypothetical protein
MRIVLEVREKVCNNAYLILYINYIGYLIILVEYNNPWYVYDLEIKYDKNTNIY